MQCPGLREIRMRSGAKVRMERVDDLNAVSAVSPKPMTHALFSCLTHCVEWSGGTLFFAWNTLPTLPGRSGAARGCLVSRCSTAQWEGGGRGVIFAALPWGCGPNPISSTVDTRTGPCFCQRVTLQFMSSPLTHLLSRRLDCIALGSAL